MKFKSWLLAFNLSRSQWTLLIAIIVILLLLQRSLWFGQASVFSWVSQNHKNHQLSVHIQVLKKRNTQMYQKILAVRHNKEAIEALARQELGMIKKNEDFYFIVSRS